jgi:RNA-directed DNA polymerase
MNLEDDKRQKARQLELALGGEGEAFVAERSYESSTAAHGSGRSGSDDEKLLELVVDWSNVEAALRRVTRNKGSPGIDGMKVEELSTHLAERWPQIRKDLLSGAYQPMPVRRHAIPKKGGGVRELGIPTVLDRLIQQCIVHVLQPRFDPTFSEHNYGYRPGRSTHGAVRAAQRFIQDGRRWVVDVDLEKFFDRVNHDVLMGRLAKRIADRRLLGLIRRYLDAGIMASGVVTESEEGMPQGGPLSPLLSNVLLDEVDKELERRGHAFARYADDCNVYVRSKRAGDRVLDALRRIFAKLRLRINESKSAVARPWDRKFLGFSYWLGRGGKIQLRVASKTLETLRERVRELTARLRGRSLSSVVKELRSYLRGWKNYFSIVDTPTPLQNLDKWIRHRLRALQLHQWRTGPTVYRALRARGVSAEHANKVAKFARSVWRTSSWSLNRAIPDSELARLGLPSLAP